MKLTEAIEYATQHPNFLAFLHNNGIQPDTAHQLNATIVEADPNFVFNEIIIDYGPPGPGPGDIRVRVRYNKSVGDFIFDNIAMRNAVAE